MGSAVARYKSMARYKSKSKPDKVYTIFLSNDGSHHYCDCWQWKMNKTCAHLDMFNHKYHKKTSSTNLQQAIDQAVDTLKQLKFMLGGNHERNERDLD